MWILKKIDLNVVSERQICEFIKFNKPSSLCGKNMLIKKLLNSFKRTLPYQTILVSFFYTHDLNVSQT